MNIWIVNPYGTLPSEGWREYRSYLLAKALALRGHAVTWWISDFEHRSKSYRGCGSLTDPLLPEGVRVIGVHSTPYKKNISIQRIFYEVNFGKEWVKAAENELAPDLIVLADPALFFGSPVVEYRKKCGCKLVLDVIDLWPELFTLALPSFMRPLARSIFHPLFQRRKKLVQSSDGVVAVSHDYLAAVMQNQQSKPPCAVAYLGIDMMQLRSSTINPKLNAQLMAFRCQFSLIVVYAGTLGDAYDMDLLLQAVARVNREGRSIGFIFAGDGPKKHDVLYTASKFSKNMLFLGSLPASDLLTVYVNADIGLMTYLPGSTVAMPVKFFDYLVGGLAILSSLDRDVRGLIEEHDVGLTYRASDIDDFFRCLNIFDSDKNLLKVIRENSKILANRYDSSVQYESFAKFIEVL
jgi:glycosyltransferase involved in cell wall biosynthesis